MQSKLFRQFKFNPKYGKPYFDFRILQNTLPYHIQNCKNRLSSADPKKVLDLWEKFREAQFDTDQQRSQKNQHSKLQALYRRPLSTNDIELHKKQGKYIKKLVQELEEKLSNIETELMVTLKQTEALKLPNMTHPDTPIEHPEIIEQKGTIPHNDLLSYQDIANYHDLLDFDSAGKVSGSKFVYFKNQLVFLELALINWAMQNISQKGYTPILTPDISTNDIAHACGFQPRDPSGQLFRLESDKCLIGTSEITLAGLMADKLIEHQSLPIRLGGFSHCFRLEAGSGATAAGLFRMHQFSKVEMFSFCNEADSEAIHQEMLSIQKDLIEQLNLPYRILRMPACDLGASAYSKYDIEVWMPSRKDWGEVTSTSNCTDYQSRRLNAQYTIGNEKKQLHTVNGTACAIPRIIIALLEYGQQTDKSVELPECLHKFLPFSRISRN